METTEIGRRDFLKTVGALGSSGLLLTAFPWLQSFAADNQKALKGEKAKLAIIGTGSRGMYHINNLLNTRQAEIVALCDIYKPHLYQAAALCPKAKKYSDYREVLASPDVQGIIIACPLHEHAPIAIAGMKAGKHVFSEKSMARTLDQCKEMYDVYKQTGQVLYIGQQRCRQKYIKARNGQYGTIVEVVGLRNSGPQQRLARPVRASLERQINWVCIRNIPGTMTIGLHQLQMNLGLKSTRLLMGAEYHLLERGRELYDKVNVIYHYPNGVKMTFESIISNKKYGMDEQILGHKGTLELAKGKYFFEEVKPAPGIQQLINQIEHKVFDQVSFAGPSWVPETASEDNGEFIVDKVKTHDGSNTTGAAGDGSEELVASFCDSVITGKPIPVLVEEAYYSSVLALLGLKAMEERSIIEFPEEYKIPYLNHA